jgi:N-hydroxyarylamine O-acetyltransferase
MHVDRYLERIGVTCPIEPNLESLRALHRAHLLAIPYENLDVQLGRPVTIEIPAIYRKIVENGRGGWCYEMNGILGWALKELGFRVTRATGAVMREMGGDASNGNHLVLRVETDEGLYLADVGFGDGPLEPFAVTPGGFTAHGFDFGLTRIDENWWRLRNHPASGAPSFDFNLAPADETLFAAQCRRLQTSPDSTFVQNVLCFRFTPEGLVNLRGRVLRTVTPQGVSERLLENAGEFQAVIGETLGLSVPEAATLWPRVCARHEQLFGEQRTA